MDFYLEKGVAAGKWIYRSSLQPFIPLSIQPVMGRVAVISKAV